MATRPTSLVLVAAVYAILSPLTRAGAVITDPVYSSREQTDEERITLFHELADGNGIVIEAAGQEPRTRQGDGSSGFETLLLTLVTTWVGAPVGTDPSSHAYFAEKCHQVEAVFEIPANASLGIVGNGVVRTEPPVSPVGPFRLKLDNGGIVHVCEYQLRVFTRSC